MPDIEYTIIISRVIYYFLIWISLYAFLSYGFSRITGLGKDHLASRLLYGLAILAQLLILYILTGDSPYGEEVNLMLRVISIYFNLQIGIEQISPDWLYLSILIILAIAYVGINPFVVKRKISPSYYLIEIAFTLFLGILVELLINPPSYVLLIVQGLFLAGLSVFESSFRDRIIKIATLIIKIIIILGIILALSSYVGYFYATNYFLILTIVLTFATILAEIILHKKQIWKKGFLGTVLMVCFLYLAAFAYIANIRLYFPDGYCNEIHNKIPQQMIVREIQDFGYNFDALIDRQENVWYSRPKDNEFVKLTPVGERIVYRYRSRKFEELFNHRFFITGYGKPYILNTEGDFREPVPIDDINLTKPMVVGNYIYVTSELSRKLYRFNKNGMLVDQTTIPSYYPVSDYTQMWINLAYDYEKEMIYAITEIPGDVFKITRDYEVLDETNLWGYRFPYIRAIEGIYFSNYTDCLYVASSDGSLFEIDRELNVKNIFTIITGLRYIAPFNAEGSILFCTSYSYSKAALFDLSTKQIVSTFPFYQLTNNLRYDDKRNWLLAAHTCGVSILTND